MCDHSMQSWLIHIEKNRSYGLLRPQDNEEKSGLMRAAQEGGAPFKWAIFMEESCPPVGADNKIVHHGRNGGI